MGNKTEWTEEWPTEPGEYLFYGWIDQWEIDNEESPSLHLVSAYESYKNLYGVWFMCDDGEIAKDKNSCGVWATIPKLPSIAHPTST